MRQTLEKEVAGLVAAHRTDSATFARVGPVAWPDGYRIAVNFTADFDAMLLRRHNNEPAEWVATGSEIAAHWEKCFPAQTHLKLEPEIWKDHEGSLS